MNNLPTEMLQSLRSECREVLKTICQRVATHEAVADGIRQLTAADDILASLLAIAQDDPEIARMILHASVAALANAQSELAIEAELQRRTAMN